MILKHSKMYKTIFFIYTIIMILSVSILQGYFYKYIHMNEIQKHIDLNKKSVNQIINYLNEIEDNSSIIKDLLYDSPSELEDINNFLIYDTQIYLTNKLNTYNFYNGEYLDMAGFVRKIFRTNSHIVYISLISFEKDNVIIFDKNGSSRTMLAPFRPQGYKSVETSSDPNVITFMKKLRDIGTQNELGILSISYKISDLTNYIKMYEQTIENHNFILLDQRGMVIYDTQNQYDYIQYPYLENNSINQDSLQTLTNSYMNVAYHNSGITVIGQIPKGIIKVNQSNVLTIFLISITVFILGEILVYLKLKSLAKRTEEILNAMENVKKGNLDIRVNQKKDNDEIGILANNFNDMCEKLNLYIQKSYLAELEQEKVKMDMLQTQINPHFLYNTLEVIRMKAICNNDREVGKMLYSLAVIFRSQVKETNIITLGKELHYCKNYIELFTLRYEDCFKFEFIYNEDVLKNTTLKFIVQPIIENYFVHGIRLDDTDNYIKIIIKDGDDLTISIEDNGKGINDDKLIKIRYNLENCLYDGNSLGIFNVQKRLIMAYGPEYKLQIENNKLGGATVSIKIPNSRIDT